MLLILVGDTYDTDTDTVDVNSKLLLEKILLNKKTLQYLRKIDNDLIIYLKCVHELEPWLVARQLGVRNTRRYSSLPTWLIRLPIQKLCPHKGSPFSVS